MQIRDGTIMLRTGKTPGDTFTWLEVEEIVEMAEEQAWQEGYSSGRWYTAASDEITGENTE